MTKPTDEAATGCHHGKNHERIWLSPPCDDATGEGRLWCREKQDACGQCGAEWVEYIRADLVPGRVETSPNRPMRRWRRRGLEAAVGLPPKPTAGMPIDKTDDWERRQDERRDPGAGEVR